MDKTDNEHEQQAQTITEDSVIEHAQLSSSGMSRGSNNFEGSKDEPQVSEESLINNAILVKSVSVKTESTTTVHTETSEGSLEDEVFKHYDKHGNKAVVDKGDSGGRRVSDITNNNIPVIKVTETENQATEINEGNLLSLVIQRDLAQALPANRDVVPPLNFGDVEDQLIGCRTPVNSEDDPVTTLETELINRTGAADRMKPDWIQDEKKMNTNVSKSINSDKKRSLSQLSLDDEPSDEDFDELVIDVANAMSTSEFETVKTTLKGLDCMTEQDLIRCTSPLAYLNQLRQYCLVSRDNLAHLQNIVDVLDKPDLHQKAMLYTRHKFDIVFFYPTRGTIPSAYEVAKCHVMGRDFTRLKRYELETIRAGIANLLFIPSKLVYIVGIEPGFSVIVTIMLHKRHIGWFQDVLIDNTSQIAKLGIDAVQLRGKTYMLDDNSRVGGIDSDYNTHAFLSVFNQLKDKNKQLEDKDEEIVRLSQEAEFMQLELETMSAELEVLTERAVQQAVNLRNPPKRERRFKRHGRSFSEPIPEVPKRYRDVTPYFWDVWVKPSTTSGYEVDRSLQNLADDINTLENGNPALPDVDLDISSAEFKDKDTLMGEIEQLLIQLGARKSYINY